MNNTVQHIKRSRQSLDKLHYTPSTMGGRIRMLRHIRGLTQQDIASACGVTKSAVSQWESSETVNIKLIPLMHLVETLGTDIQYLVYGPRRRQRPYQQRSNGAYSQPTDSPLNGGDGQFDGRFDGRRRNTPKSNLYRSLD